MHAVKIKRQINALNREREFYRARIEQDSTLLERLRYDGTAKNHIFRSVRKA